MALSVTASLVVADGVTAVTSPAYINLNTGCATMSDLPTGSWAGALNAGYSFDEALAVEVGYSILPSSQYGSTTGTEQFRLVIALYAQVA